jgi:hypothetical protein
MQTFGYLVASEIISPTEGTSMCWRPGNLGGGLASRRGKRVFRRSRTLAMLVAGA